MLNSDLIQLVSPIGAEAICALLPLRDRERSDGLTKLYPTQLEALTQLRVRSSGMARGAMPGSLVWSVKATVVQVTFSCTGKHYMTDSASQIGKSRIWAEGAYLRDLQRYYHYTYSGFSLTSHIPDICPQRAPHAVGSRATPSAR